MLPYLISYLIAGVILAMAAAISDSRSGKVGTHIEHVLTSVVIVLGWPLLAFLVGYDGGKR